MYNLHILASDQKKVLFFRATYEQPSLQKATFEQLFKKLLENFPWREKATNRKPSTDKRCLTPRHA